MSLQISHENRGERVVTSFSERFTQWKALALDRVEPFGWAQLRQRRNEMVTAASESGKPSASVRRTGMGHWIPANGSARTLLNVQVEATALDDRLAWMEHSEDGTTLRYPIDVLRCVSPQEAIAVEREFTARFRVVSDGVETVRSRVFVDGKEATQFAAESRFAVATGAVQPKKKTIFVSYAHADERFLSEFEAMLGAVKRSFAVWSDRVIMPSKEWRAEIRQALEASDAGLLLVTDSFFDSEFIEKEELPRLLEGKHVFWVSIDYSLYDETPLAEIQCLNDPEEPLAHLSKAKKKKAIRDACKNLIRTLREDPASNES